MRVPLNGTAAVTANSRNAILPRAKSRVSRDGSSEAVLIAALGVNERVAAQWRGRLRRSGHIMRASVRVWTDDDWRGESRRVIVASVVQDGCLAREIYDRNEVAGVGVMANEVMPGSRC